MKILVTGGTGFIGPKVVHALRAQGRDVRALVRSPDRGAQLASWGVELATGDVTDPVTVRNAIDGCTHVVHLVAILRGRPQDFDRVMTEGFRNVLAAAKEQGVERAVLMSALGTNDASKDVVPYYRAKWQMEQDVQASGLEHVIFRPSFVFGPGGGALPTFIRQVKVSPVVTVIGPGLQRSQPIWIEDVAAHFARAIDLPQAAGRTYEVGGPDTVTWNELYQRIARVLGKRRRLVHVPWTVARTGARLTERLPGAPLSVDQVAMLQAADNVVGSPDAVDTFQIPLLPLDEQIRRSA
ncbi:MAG TPA: complex I NDUFA9 subunit family protein [Gaiellaceae bacterium]|nr:complex I NDUFA9 subunit family protein [Gaiellaceae bacterium]HLM34537.1 complex I NDUFA9 subunit family protein [Gaiellaceae bacterium]